ncbi:MAG: restriction endonuclease subunit S [Aureliella sp.]
MRTIDTPDSWQRVLLGDICEADAPIMYGILQPGPEIADGVPYVRPTEISPDGIRLDEIKRTTPEIAAKYKRSTLKSGDLLITIVGTLGRIAEVPEELDGANITQSSARIRLNPNEAHAGFVRHFLKSSPLATRQYDWHRLGTGVPRLNIHHVRELQIPLPPLSEQKRIADILDKADAIRRKRQQATTYRDQLIKSAFIAKFGDPATNPRSLPLRSLSDFYVNSKEGTKCGPFGGALKKSEYTSSGIAVWNMDNISVDGRLVGSPKLWVSPEKYNELSAYAVEDGDILISRAGTVGKMCVVRGRAGESLISTNLIRLRLNPQLLPEYFVSLMVSFKGRVGRLKTGPDGAFTHMSTGVLDTLMFPYPPPAEQTEFCQVLQHIEESARRRNHAVDTSKDLFHSLVQRAFRGEL